MSGKRANGLGASSKGFLGETEGRFYAHKINVERAFRFEPILREKKQRRRKAIGTTLNSSNRRRKISPGVGVETT